MKISELFRQLSYGELSNLSMSKNGSGEIVEDKHPQLIQYANTALQTIFSRFRLREKELRLVQVEGITRYHLTRRFTESAGAAGVIPYIKDAPPRDPFLEDVIRILAVYDKDGQRALNDEGNPDSLFAPRPDTLQVPAPDAGYQLAVLYQARHPELDDRPGKIINQKIDIPFFLEKALKSSIAHQVFSNMNGQENTLKGQEHLATYEAICIDIEQRDLVNQTFHTSHSKLEMRGFV